VVIFKFFYTDPRNLDLSPLVRGRYSPTTPQVSDFIDKVRSIAGLEYLSTVEVTYREWEFEGRKVRPKSQSIGHSGFMTFVRKISD